MQRIKKDSWFHNNTVIPSEEIGDIMKIVKSFEDYGLLINQTIENETEELIGGFLGMLVGILGASLLGNMSAGKDEGKGSEVIRAGKGTLTAGQNF